MLNVIRKTKIALMRMLAVMLVLALKPVGLDLLWTILIPLVICLFACVAGLAANLVLPRFDWTNEVTIVKQSASAALGGFAPTLQARKLHPGGIYSCRGHCFTSFQRES